MCDVEDEESMDDPISLIHEGFPEDNVQKSSSFYVVEDDVEDDPISLIIKPYKKYVDTDIVDLRSSDDESEGQHTTPKSGYGNKNFIIPVTFLDSYRNVKLLKKCKPLSIKVVDCDKHPWYYGNRGARKSTVNLNCQTLGKYSNVNEQKIKVEKADEDAVILENERLNSETLEITQCLNDKAQDQGELKSKIINVTLIPETINDNCQKLKNEPEIAKKLKDLSQVDLKRNSGLVGLTISKKDLDLNLEKVTKNFDSNLDKVIKKTRKKRKKENIVNKTDMQEIGVALNNLGTSVTPVPEKKDDNVLESKTKDNHASNVDLHDLPSSSNTSDKINNNTISPTRCSFKITSSKILEKIIQLKKSKNQDASKAKPQQKPKKIFDKDHELPKLNLKRRPTTENDEFYVVSSNKGSRCDSLSVQSQEPQNNQNILENVINKKNSVATSAIIPSVNISVKNHKPFTPNTSINAKNLEQTQCGAALPTPRCYHKKINHKKSVVNNAPNKIIQNEPITSICYFPNNQDINASNCSLTSGLDEVVVSQVQSMRNMNTLSSNRPNYGSPKNTATRLSKPKGFKLKRVKNIDTAAANSNSNVNEKDENVIRNEDATTLGTKVNKTHVLQAPSLSFLEVYNAHVLNCHNGWKELSRKTRRVTKPDKNKSEVLKETEKNATEQQTNRPKDTVTLTNNNINLTNYDIPNRDAVTNTSNTNNAATPPKTDLNIQRFTNGKQLDEYLYMKQNQFNTQPNHTHTVNNFLPIRTQVYHLPGNNTVISRKPPAHIQTRTNQTPGLPIQTVVNHRPTNIPKPSTRTFSPWPFPPPNTNVASNVHNYSMQNTNIYSENQMYPQYYWEATNSGNPYLPSPPLVLRQENYSNLIPVRNQVSDDSIIGSTANGDLIKKINIGVLGSNSTVVDDKQKMLDTLNCAINEWNDFLPKISDPRSLLHEKRAKPCPLSKKAKIDPVSNVEPSKGYSPPILPIPTFQRAIELVKMKQEVHNRILSQVEKMGNIELDTNSIDKYDRRSVQVQDISKRKKPTIENKKQDKTKKISLEEYKKRVSKDGVDANKVAKHKCKRRKVTKNVVDNNQDLGYDSDATMKL